MHKTFKSRVDWFYKATLIIIPIILSFGIYFMSNDPQVGKFELLAFIMTFLMIYGLLLLLLFQTNYRIHEDRLFCKSGFFKKEFEIASIRKIEKGVKLYAGWKLGLAFKGLVIHYNKYDELYITPENEDEFIEILKKINPAIQILSR